MRQICASGCWPMSASGLANGRSSCCCAAMEIRQESTGFIDFTAKKGCGCASDKPGARPWAAALRSWSRRGQTPGGRWISPMTRSPVVGGFAS